jgi:hypothetical protein
VYWRQPTCASGVRGENTRHSHWIAWHNRQQPSRLRLRLRLRRRLHRARFRRRLSPAARLAKRLLQVASHDPRPRGLELRSQRACRADMHFIDDRRKPVHHEHRHASSFYYRGAVEASKRRARHQREAPDGLLQPTGPQVHAPAIRCADRNTTACNAVSYCSGNVTMHVATPGQLLSFSICSACALLRSSSPTRLSAAAAHQRTPCPRIICAHSQLLRAKRFF